MNIIGQIDPSAFACAPRMHHGEPTAQFPSSASSRRRALNALKAQNWRAAKRPAPVVKQFIRLKSGCNDRLVVPVVRTGATESVTSVEFVTYAYHPTVRRALFGWGANNTDYVCLEQDDLVGQGTSSAAKILLPIDLGTVYRVVATQTRTGQNIKLYSGDSMLGENTFNLYPGISSTNMGLFRWNGTGGYDNSAAYGLDIGISSVSVSVDGVLRFSSVPRMIGTNAGIYDSVGGQIIYGLTNPSNFEIVNLH